MSWSCGVCTFINEDSSSSACIVCGSGRNAANNMKKQKREKYQALLNKYPRSVFDCILPCFEYDNDDDNDGKQDQNNENAQGDGDSTRLAKQAADFSRIEYAKRNTDIYQSIIPGLYLAAGSALRPSLKDSNQWLIEHDVQAVINCCALEIDYKWDALTNSSGDHAANNNGNIDSDNGNINNNNNSDSNNAHDSTKHAIDGSNNDRDGDDQKDNAKHIVHNKNQRIATLLVPFKDSAGNPTYDIDLFADQINEIISFIDKHRGVTGNNIKNNNKSDDDDDKNFTNNENSDSCGGSVLVHCSAGYSRSAAVVIAYIIKKLDQSLVEAVQTVRARRKVHPIKQFWQALIAFELAQRGQNTITLEALDELYP